MRAVLRSLLASALTFALVSGQSSLAPRNTVCQVPPTCPTTPVAVPPAWFNADFNTNPSSITGVPTTSFGWEQTEAGDAACTGGYQHQGIATFNASLGQFVDLNYIASGNSSGYALPGLIGGQGAGSFAAGTAGWTFEATVRIHPDAGNSKMACIGAGAPLYNIFLSNDGAGNGVNFGLYDGNGNANNPYAPGRAGILELVTPYVQYQWYHFVAVLQQVAPASRLENNVTHGAWFLYVNGQLLNYPGGVSQDNILPVAVPRPFAYLGKSDWSDPYWSGLIDTFRIYNYALSGSQAGQLYAGEMAGCAVPQSTAPPAVMTPNVVPVTTTGTVTPYFSATFTTNPLTTTTGASGYGWSQQLSSDSPTNQAVHTGLLTLSGSSQYVNLALASGANSIGQVLPTIGGGPAGWTIEIMFISFAGADAWSKVYDLGSTRNPNPLNDIVLGWYGNGVAPDTMWQFDVADNTTAGNQFQTNDALGEVSYSTWVHAVAVIQPIANGNANYLIYYNGALYTSVSNVFYPVAAPRQNSYIGRSGWSDPYFNGAVDFFNVYNQALSGTQIAALYNTAITPPPPSPTVCTPTPSCPTTPETVPPAWYALTFASNPASLTGSSSPTYTWENVDSGDSGCPFQHQGVISFNSTAANYIDLNFATGANSSGVALPGVIGGASAGTLAAGTAGWSFEMTFRPGGNFGNAKLFSAGSGAPQYNIFLSQDSTNDGGLNFGLFDGNTNGGSAYTDGHSGILELVNPAVINQWYHVVAVLQQVVPLAGQTTENGVQHGAWFLYVNGQLLTFPTGVTQDNILPVAIARAAYLGKSNFGDAYWQGLIDTFRIYNYALSASQAAQLYAGDFAGCTVPQSTNPPAAIYPNILPRTATGTVTPFFSATFTTNPLLTTTGASGYGWSQQLKSDSPNNQYLHQGLLTLSGSSQYVNLALASGANSIGQVLPTIGGGSAGWTFEVMVQASAGADGWSKVYDLGTTRTGNPLNDIVFGWDGSAVAPDTFWQFDVCDNTTAGNQWQTGDAIGEAPSGQWYHVVATIVPTANGFANYFIYLNGVLYTTVTGGFYPVAATRQNLYLGRSGWSDPYFNGAIDFFNVYSQALSDVQVANLYSAATTIPASYYQTVCTPTPSCPTTPVSVPPAWYNLTFGTNPSTLTGVSSPTYVWEAVDSGDAACPFQHRGVLSFNSASSQYVDLNAATGASSVGFALPGVIGGPSAGTLASGTAGWSFEAVVRPSGNFGNAKMVSIGAGAPLNNIFLSQDGTNNGGLNFGLYDGNTLSSVQYSAGHAGIDELVTPYVIQQWYHLVAVLQQVSSSQLAENNATHGAWFLYVNGQLVTNPGGISQDNILPSPVLRPFAYLGKSDWNDPYWTGLIDTFRIYNYALTGAQASQLYAGEMGGCSVPVSTTPPDPSLVFPNLLPRLVSGPVTPYFSATFSSNPLLTTTGASGYGWAQTLGSDSQGNASIHQGLLTLNASASQFVNLYLASGANSIGQVLGTVGGGVLGWTFEVMMLSLTGADTWPKVYDLGSLRSNNPLNDILLGWDGNSGAPDHFWQAAVYDNTTAGNAWQTPDAIGEVPYNTWIHAVTVISPPTQNGLCNIFTYYQGQLYTTINNAFCPVAAPRQNSYLGKSGWSDPYFSGAIDFFNVYSQALSDVQVANLYSAASQPVGSTVASGSLCFLLYSLPGNIDYPWSVALSFPSVYYNPAPVSTGQGGGQAVQVLNGTGTRTYTNRFGIASTSSATLTTAGATGTSQLLYLGSATPVDALGLSYVLATPIQLPGQGPMLPTEQVTLQSVVGGGVGEVGATRGDPQGQAVFSSIPGFQPVSIGASNINSLAVQAGVCAAPISFTNGLRAPTQPSVSNGALTPTYSYTISDGLTYSIQANLSLTTTSQFASRTDLLGNPYQSVVSISGTRQYTYLPTGATLLSTITGVSTGQTLTSSQRLYPYALLASAPGVYSSNTAPFLDGEGLEYSIQPPQPLAGNAPGTALTSAITVYIGTPSNSAPVSTINELGAVNPALIQFQQQVYKLS